MQEVQTTTTRRKIWCQPPSITAKPHTENLIMCSPLQVSCMYALSVRFICSRQFLFNYCKYNNSTYKYHQNIFSRATMFKNAPEIFPTS